MSEEDFESEDMYWEEDANCLYGFEFCSDPQTRDMGICTTECEEYLDSVSQELEANLKKREGEC